MIALPRAFSARDSEKGKPRRRAVLMQTAAEVAEGVSLVHAADCRPVYKALFCTFRIGTCQLMLLCPRVVTAG